MCALDEEVPSSITSSTNVGKRLVDSGLDILGSSSEFNSLLWYS